MSEWVEKQDPLYCLQETHLKYKDSYKLKVDGWREKEHAKTNQKKALVAILIANRADFR